MLLPSMPPPDTLRGEIIVSLALGRLLHRFRRHGTVAHFLEYLRESRSLLVPGCGRLNGGLGLLRVLAADIGPRGGRFLARTCAAAPAIAPSTITDGPT